MLLACIGALFSSRIRFHMHYCHKAFQGKTLYSGYLLFDGEHLLHRGLVDKFCVLSSKVCVLLQLFEIGGIFHDTRQGGIPRNEGEIYCPLRDLLS
jgi:hypothetical protein